MSSFTLLMLYTDYYLPDHETCVRPMRDAPLSVQTQFELDQILQDLFLYPVHLLGKGQSGVSGH